MAKNARREEEKGRKGEGDQGSASKEACSRLLPPTKPWGQSRGEVADQEEGREDAASSYQGRGEEGRRKEKARDEGCLHLNWEERLPKDQKATAVGKDDARDEGAASKAEGLAVVQVSWNSGKRSNEEVAAVSDSLTGADWSI